MLPTRYLRDKGGWWWSEYGPILMVNERQRTAKDRTIYIASFSVHTFIRMYLWYNSTLWVITSTPAEWLPQNQSFHLWLVLISPLHQVCSFYRYMLSVTTFYFFSWICRCNFKQCLIMYTVENSQSVMTWFSFDLNLLNAITFDVFDMHRPNVTCCDVVCTILVV